MTKLAYNASIAIGVALISIGAGMQWSVGIALMVAGALVIGLTIFAVKGL